MDFRRSAILLSALAASLAPSSAVLAFQPSPTTPYTFGKFFLPVSQDRLGDGNFHDLASCNQSGPPLYFCPNSGCTIGYFGAGQAAAPILHELSRTSSGQTETVTIGIEYFVWNAYCNPPADDPQQPNSVSFQVDLISIDTNGAGAAVIFSFDPYWEHGQVTLTINLTGCPGRRIQARYLYQTPSGTREVRSKYLGPYGRDISGQLCKPPLNFCPLPAPGKPINPGGGNMRYTEPLYSVMENAFPLAITLAYNSLGTATGPLGTGFTHPFAQTIKPLPSASNVVTWTNGQGEEILYRTGNAGVDPFLPMWPADATGTVSLNSGAGIYTLTDVNGTVTTFGSAAGEWRSTADRWGNTLRGAYTGGNLTSITDPEGRVWSLVYSGSQLGSVTDPDLHVWTFSYDGAGHLQTVRDPFHATGNPWRQYTYVTAGTRTLLAQVQDDALAVLEGHEYDALGRATSSWSGDTVVTSGVPHPGSNARDLVTLSYDTNTQTTVTSKIDATTNQVSTFTYVLPAGRVLPTSIVGNCTTCGGSADQQLYTYDAFNHPLTAVVGAGTEQSETDSTYDGNGMVLTRKEAVGKPEQRTTTYAYGLSSWPAFATSLTEASAAKPGQSKITTNTWNVGETQLTTSVSGYLKSADASATVYTTTTLFDAKHRSTEVDGPATNQKTTLTYYSDTDTTLDRRGRLQQTSVYTSATAHLDTQFDNYDVFGTARKIIDPNGVESDRMTDAKGRVTSVTALHVTGDPNESTDYTTSYGYDFRDRLASTTLPLHNGLLYQYEDGTNRLLSTTRIDSGGNDKERLRLTLNVIGGKTLEEAQICNLYPVQACAIYETRRQESFSYDSNNRLGSIVHPDASHIDYGYDSRGNLTTVKDENHSTPNTKYCYDSLNRMISVIQTLSGASGGSGPCPVAAGQIATSYAYDVQDNLTSVTDPNGNSTTYAYDDFRRLQTQTSPVSGATNYSYDPAGNLLTTTDANGATTTRVYDAANRVASATSTRTGFSSEAVTWTYDDATAGSYGKGRLATMTDPDPSSSVAYAYERRGLLRSELRTIQGDSYSLAFGYDANGNRSSINYPSGLIVKYTFDLADRPGSACSGGTGPNCSGGTTYVSAASYQPFGPESSLSFGNGTTSMLNYDMRYRPTEVGLFNGGSTIVDNLYSEDAVGNITSVCAAQPCPTPSKGYDRVFGYDDLNRLTTANSGASLWGAGSYFYDAMGNVTSLALGSRSVNFAYVQSGGHQTPKVATASDHAPPEVTYDGSGNETGVGVATYTYSARNFLVSGDGPSYTYDGRGLRTVVNATVGAPAPTVSSINPTSGTTAGGTPVTIGGANFQTGATVSLGGVAATGVTVTPPNTITATTGAHAAGAVDVVVTNPDSQSGTLTNGFTYVTPAPAPTVTSINPTSGTTGGGTPVTIGGTNFQTGATVSLGGVAATGVTVTPPNTITATTGAHAAGAVDVVVTNPDSQSGTLPGGFTYVAPPPAPTVTSINPTSGTTAGGTPVTIGGTNFQTGATVSLGGVAATGVTVTPPNTITAMTGAHAAGAVDVVVTNLDSQSGTLPGGFTYVAPPPPPTIGSFTPTSAVTGTSVTINGTNFTGATSVTFNGVAASYTVNTAIKITATVPESATTGKIGVTTPGGTATSTGTFTVNPKIGSFSPASGAVGIPVTITGSGFTGATAVKFNGTTAGYTVDSATQITATVPANATTGTITVTTPAGTATSAISFTVAPRITSFTPTNGAVGASVTINGANFTGATSVTFNGTSAIYTVNTSVKITATVPAGATTGPIAVTTSAGTATSATNFTVNFTPTITGFLPTSGAVGISVTITGTNFTGATAVKFNGTSATFHVDSGAQITATVPTNATTGKITVTTPGGTATSATDFTVAPRISSFSPTSGVIGSSVTVNGANFTGATSVTFNGVSAGFTVNTSIKITATVPAGATTGMIAVTTAAGTATSTGSFTVKPNILSFAPTSGAVGVSVTITGTAFTGATAVKFNGTTATFTVNSSTQITATVPANATTGTISVTTPGGTATSATSFTVAPRITSFTPTSGTVGTSVTINGANFTGATAVKFNTTSATFTVNSSIKITSPVPAGAATGKISVTTPAGTGLSATDFTVTVAALGSPSSEIADAGSGVSEGTPLDPAKEPGVASGSSLVSIGAEVNSEEVHGSQIGMRLTQVALDQKRLSVERVASLAFPFASGRASAVDLSLRNVRLLGGNWPMSGDSGSPTRLMSGPATRPEEVSGDGAATASVAIRPKAVTSVGRRYSFYSPEMNLLAESEIRTDAGAPAILYEYVWFNGHPVAQVDAGTTTHWTFTDHLGTPIIQTDSGGAIYWQADHEPYGEVFALRTADQHQPLRLPGQEAEQLNLGPNGATERSYNVFRWYRPNWGRYTQADPLGLPGGINAYAYAADNPEDISDPLGLFCTKDFVLHYYLRRGTPIDLAAVGLLQNFKTATSVLGARTSFKRNALRTSESLSRSLCAGVQCGQRSGRFSMSDSVITDVTNDPCLFSVGHSTFFRQADCGVVANCGDKTFAVTCGMTFFINDWFRDPLSLGFETGGKPYRINAFWTEPFYGSGRF